MKYVLKRGNKKPSTLKIYWVYPTEYHKFATYYISNRSLLLRSKYQGVNMVRASLYRSGYLCYEDYSTGISVSCSDYNFDVTRIFSELKTLEMETRTRECVISDWLYDILVDMNKLLSYKNEMLANYVFVKDEYSHLNNPFLTWTWFYNENVMNRCSDELKPFINKHINKSVEMQTKEILLVTPPIAVKSARK